MNAHAQSSIRAASLRGQAHQGKIQQVGQRASREPERTRNRDAMQVYPSAPTRVRTELWNVQS